VVLKPLKQLSITSIKITTFSILYSSLFIWICSFLVVQQYAHWQTAQVWVQVVCDGMSAFEQHRTACAWIVQKCQTVDWGAEEEQKLTLICTLFCDKRLWLTFGVFILFVWVYYTRIISFNMQIAIKTIEGSTTDWIPDDRDSSK
jgi:hypothetical protein